MNIIILKTYLQEELINYNYVLGSKLLIIFLNNLKIIYSNDNKVVESLEEFINFLTSISDELENVKNGINILCNINNIEVIIKLLCFFNPNELHKLHRKV